MRLKQRQPKVVLKMSTDSPTIMDLASLSSELMKISMANQKVLELSECLNEIIQINHEAEVTQNFIEDCEKVNMELENERKSHAEELRQINQDINHLEDTLKGVKSSKDSKKALIAQKYEEVERELEKTNEILRESGVPEDELLTAEKCLPTINDQGSSKELQMINDPTAAILFNQLSPLTFLNFLQRQRASLFSSSEDNGSIIFSDRNRNTTTACDQTKMKFRYFYFNIINMPSMSAIDTS
uniref:HAP1 N-terminal domain-containing protein n=1 Tax=Syphacia muris TaxID=451379 RepID=A0A0N5B199_9BILA